GAAARAVRDAGRSSVPASHPRALVGRDCRRSAGVVSQARRERHPPPGDERRAHPAAAAAVPRRLPAPALGDGSGAFLRLHWVLVVHALSSRAAGIEAAAAAVRLPRVARGFVRSAMVGGLWAEALDSLDADGARVTAADVATSSARGENDQRPTKGR